MVILDLGIDIFLLSLAFGENVDEGDEHLKLQNYQGGRLATHGTKRILLRL